MQGFEIMLRLARSFACRTVVLAKVLLLDALKHRAAD
jgi:hypothetical protein